MRFLSSRVWAGSNALAPLLLCRVSAGTLLAMLPLMLCGVSLTASALPGGLINVVLTLLLHFGICLWSAEQLDCTGASKGICCLLLLELSVSLRLLLLGGITERAGRGWPFAVEQCVKVTAVVLGNRWVARLGRKRIRAGHAPLARQCRPACGMRGNVACRTLHIAQAATELTLRQICLIGCRMYAMRLPLSAMYGLNACQSQSCEVREMRSLPALRQQGDPSTADLAWLYSPLISE